MRECSSFREKITILKYDFVPVNKVRRDKKPAMKDAFAKWTANLRIEKYNTRESYEKGVPDEIQTVEGNTATTKGLFILWNLAMGLGPADETTAEYEGNTITGIYPLNSDNTYIAVGNGTQPASASDTQLYAQETGENIQDYYYKQCDDYYPIVDSNNNTTLQVRATFEPSEANFAWNEWGVANGDMSNISSPRTADNVVLFNRRQETMGTKGDEATWVIIADLIISPAVSS